MISEIEKYCITLIFESINHCYIVPKGLMESMISNSMEHAQAGGVSGISLSFNGWALKKRGPVFVSMFSPIGTVCSVIFSVFTLGNTINIGRYNIKIL
jgi:hypothetical protein